MRVKAYLRVSYNKKRRVAMVQANQRPSSASLTDGYGKPLPTVAFAVLLDIPDGMFAQAEQVIAELTIPESAVRIAAEVKP